MNHAREEFAFQTFTAPPRSSRTCITYPWPKTCWTKSTKTSFRIKTRWPKDIGKRFGGGREEINRNQHFLVNENSRACKLVSFGPEIFAEYSRGRVPSLSRSRPPRVENNPSRSQGEGRIESSSTVKLNLVYRGVEIFRVNVEWNARQVRQHLELSSFLLLLFGQKKSSNEKKTFLRERILIDERSNLIDC